VWHNTYSKVKRRLAERSADALQHVHSLFILLLPSWPPSGSELLTPNAHGLPNHVAPLFGRQSGCKTHLNIIGHRVPV